MKKLMIAAAAAAMIGGAEAMTYAAYDFSASLKTTTGKYGNDTGKKELGINAQGNTFWYDDVECVPALPYPRYDKDGKLLGYFKDVVGASGYLYPAVVTFNQNKKTGVWSGKFNADFKKLDNEEKADIADTFGETYHNRSGGKWCETFTYKLTGCYRVAGSKKIVCYLDDAADCCSNGFTADYNVDTSKVKNYYDLGSLTVDLLHRFGGKSLAKSCKVEFMGSFVDNGIWGGADTFYLAGQGTWAKLCKDDNGVDYYGVKSISGNIVGALPVTMCETCCEYPVPADFWDCDETSCWDVNFQGSFETAAYGTFTLKFNKKNSDLQ